MNPEENKKIQEYQKSNLPRYLRSQRKGLLLNRILRLVNYLKGIEPVSDKTRRLLEKGSFLVVSNHFGGETPVLLGLLSNHDVHIVASGELNWKRSSFRAWVMRRLRMVSVPDTLNSLSEEEKVELLKRVPKSRKQAYQRVIERKVPFLAKDRFVKQAVALLSRGDVVAIYPEGLFLYNGKRALRHGYRGFEFIAKCYEQLMDQELPIVPVAMVLEGDTDKDGRKIRIGEPLVLSKNQTELSDTDWVMTHLAQLLPENQRGYYKNTHL